MLIRPKTLSLSTCITLHWSSFVKCWVYNKLKFKSVLISKYTEHYKKCIISHAQNTIAFQPNIFLIETHQSMVTNKWRSPFSSVRNCQGQMQTPQPVTVRRAPYMSFPLTLLHFPKIEILLKGTHPHSGKETCQKTAELLQKNSENHFTNDSQSEWLIWRNVCFLKVVS